jgi:uncharacterized protein (UPF0179 family)
LTVLGKAQARKGYSFIFNGIPQTCQQCPYKSACLENLEAERIYTVINIPEKEMFCILRDEKGILVEVEEAHFTILLKAEAAIPGAVFTYTRSSCPIDCQNSLLCHPPGIQSGDKCLIQEVKDFIECPEGLKLASVKAERIS